MNLINKKLITIRFDQKVNDLCAEYLSAVRETYDTHASLVTKSAHRFRVSPWITPEIKAARLLQRSNERIWRRSKLEVHRQIYRQHQHEVNRLICKVKRTDYEECLATRDLRKTFQVINEVTKADTVNLQAPPSTALCNQFLEFFANKISTIQADIEKLVAAENLPTDSTSDIATDVTSTMDQIRPIR